MHFLQSLLEYDKDNIPAAIIEKIRPYIQNPEFKPEKIKRISKAAMSLCAWVRAIETYHNVLQDVKPKRTALEEAEAKLEIVMSKLAAMKAQFAVLEGGIQ